MFTYKIIVN